MENLSFHRSCTSKLRILYSDKRLEHLLTPYGFRCSVSYSLRITYKWCVNGSHRGWYGSKCRWYKLWANEQMIVVAENEPDLKKLFSVVYGRCNKMRLRINCDKSEIIHFRKRSHELTFTFCFGQTIVYYKKYKWDLLWMNILHLKREQKSNPTQLVEL